jgi:ABC-type branched-subunit amino acid transport system ATPase component
MKLNNIRVQGFQAFSDSGLIEFKNGINLIVGQNNAGKSSLMRAFLPSISSDKHRTPSDWEDFNLPEPKFNYTITVSGAELKRIILRMGTDVNVPVPASLDQGQSFNYVDRLLSSENIKIDVSGDPIPRFTRPIQA